ncbi:MAG: phosphoglucosamine mutase [Eubacteriales bacterium]
MGKLFGTDGIRGIANAGLDSDLAYRVGLAVATVLQKTNKRPTVAIGKDTRISGDLLKGSLIAGLCTAGADVLDLGTISTPAVAKMTINQKATAGIVISASHNPFEHNGIKIFNDKGFKLSDKLEEKVEEIVLLGYNNIERRTHSNIGKVTYLAPRAVENYVDYLCTTVNHTLEGLRILVDCGNGASYTTAALLFERFPKLHADIINIDPDGVNINQNCGSTHVEELSAMIVAGHYDLGIAFDGDADRCLLLDEKGSLIDGDQMLALYGLSLKNQNKLPQDTIVGTVMSNLGLHVFAKEHGLLLKCTDVGDRNVLELMEEEGLAMGAEQSGHVIFREYATTGDGQLTALQMLALLKESGKKASELFGACPKYPQVLQNIPVTDKDKKQEIMESAKLAKGITEIEEILGDSGRVLVRPSGTEALIRVMVEAKTQEQAEASAKKLIDLVRKL